MSNDQDSRNKLPDYYDMKLPEFKPTIFPLSVRSIEILQLSDADKSALIFTSDGILNWPLDIAIKHLPKHCSVRNYQSKLVISGYRNLVHVLLEWFRQMPQYLNATYITHDAWLYNRKNSNEPTYRKYIYAYITNPVKFRNNPSYIEEFMDNYRKMSWSEFTELIRDFIIKFETQSRTKHFNQSNPINQSEQTKPIDQPESTKPISQSIQSAIHLLENTRVDLQQFELAIKTLTDENHKLQQKNTELLALFEMQKTQFETQRTQLNEQKTQIEVQGTQLNEQKTQFDELQQRYNTMSACLTEIHRMM